MWGSSGLRAAIGGFRPPAETLPVTIGGPGRTWALASERGRCVLQLGDWVCPSDRLTVSGKRKQVQPGRQAVAHTAGCPAAPHSTGEAAACQPPASVLQSVALHASTTAQSCLLSANTVVSLRSAATSSAAMPALRERSRVSQPAAAVASRRRQHSAGTCVQTRGTSRPAEAGWQLPGPASAPGPAPAPSAAAHAAPPRTPPQPRRWECTRPRGHTPAAAWTASRVKHHWHQTPAGVPSCPTASAWTCRCMWSCGRHREGSSASALGVMEQSMARVRLQNGHTRQPCNPVAVSICLPLLLHHPHPQPHPHPAPLTRCLQAQAPPAAWV